MGVTTRTVTRYYCTREVLDFDGAPTRQRKAFLDVNAAWRWVARAALFNARAAKECSDYQDNEGYPCACKLCDPKRYGPVVERLARIMRHRAEKEAKP